MALTLRSIANDLLAHIDRKLSASTPFTGAVDSGEDLPTSCEAYLVNTLNLAAEECRTLCPRFFIDTISVVFPAAATGTVSVTANSKALTLGTLTAPTNGSTIVISGDSAYNEIEAASSNYELLFAFGGSTGTTTATLYGDSQILPTNADSILGAIAIAGRRPLVVLNSRHDLLTYHAELVHDYGQLRSPGDYQRRKVGEVEAIYIETSPTHSGTIEYRARCAPLPSTRTAVELEIKTIPTEIASADLNNTANKVFPTPGKRQYSILRALALYHWLSSPWFRPSSTALRAIERGYAEALQQLESYRVNASAARRVIHEGC